MKKFWIVFFFILALVLLALTVWQYDAKAGVDEPEAEPVGLLRKYKIIKVYPDEMHYDLEAIPTPGEPWSCNQVITGVCVTGGQVEALGTNCVVIGNQKLHCKYQDIRWEETKSQTCSAFIANASQPSETPCCTTCKMCYEVGHTNNDDKWVKEKDLGCSKFGDNVLIMHPGAQVRLYSPQELKATRVCETPKAKMTVTLEKLIGADWQYYDDISGRFADDSGKTDCNDIDWSTAQFRQLHSYLDNGCPCLNGIALTDPGEKIEPNE